MNTRLRQKYKERLDELLSFLEEGYSRFGFNRDELLQICKVQVSATPKGKNELRTNLLMFQQIQKQVAGLSGVFRDILNKDLKQMEAGLVDIVDRLNFYLDELQNGPNKDRVFFSVMRYLIYFRLKGRALYSAAVGICVCSGAVPASEFGLDEKSPARLFDPMGKIPNERKFNAQVKKKYDRLFDQYDANTLKEWDPPDPRAPLLDEERQTHEKTCKELQEQMDVMLGRVLDEYPVIGDKAGKREALAGWGISRSKDSVRDSKRPQKSRTRRPEK